MVQRKSTVVISDLRQKIEAALPFYPPHRHEEEANSLCLLCRILVEL